MGQRGGAVIRHLRYSLLGLAALTASIPGTLPASAQQDSYIGAVGGAPSAGTPLDDSLPETLIGAGDIATGGSGDEATANLLDVMPGTVFTLGDNAYGSGTDAEFADYYAPTWGRHRARTLPSAGNHDYNTAGAAGYFNYFGAAAGDPGQGYYSYNLGGWHIVVLNSNCSQVGGCSAGSAQEQWLRADLAANESVCIAAYWHHPLFTNGAHSPSTSVRPFWQALYDYGAEIILNGHDHNYQRFSPQNPYGAADPNGIREFVAGTGGASHIPFTQPPVINTEARDDTAFGVLKLTLRATGYDWQFIAEAGNAYTDSGSASCTGAPPPTPGDSDGDGVPDATEAACGSDPNNGSIPERIDGSFAGMSDDGDLAIDEGLPAGSSAFDCDGDGWTGAQEALIFGTGGTVSDQDACGNDGWPFDLDPSNSATIGDINSLFFPLGPNDGHGAFAYFGHPVPDAGRVNERRWDLDPNGVIDIGDINALNPGVTAPTARPPMFGGQPAFFAVACPWP